jgi:hypothetical protein
MHGGEEIHIVLSIGQRERKRSAGRPRRKWKGNIRMILEKMDGML